MPYNWDKEWHWIRNQHAAVERAAERLQGLMHQSSSPMNERAAALRELAEQLCIFLSRCRDAGYLDALALEGQEALNDEYRGHILEHLEGVMRRERAVLDLMKIESRWSDKVMADLRDRLPTALTRDRIEAEAWKTRIRAATDEICSAPTSLIGDVAARIQPLAQKLGKGTRVARWVVLGVANSLVIVKIPEPFTVVKTSKAIAYAMIALDGGQG